MKLKMVAILSYFTDVFRDKRRRRPIVAAALAAALAFSVRLPYLGQFMTIDEHGWMQRDSEFYDKVFQDKDIAGTFLTTHPGVLTMWLSGAGIAAQEIRTGINLENSTIWHFRKVATLPMAVATATLVGAIAYLAILLFGEVPGIAAGTFLALDPYITGMGQIVHVDGLLALCMFAAFLCVLLFREKRQTQYLVVAGIFAGLAMSNKLLPSLWTFVASGAVLLTMYWRNYHQLIRTSLLMGGVAVLSFYAIWPALWVKDDLFHSFSRDTENVVTQEHIAVEESDDPISPESFYIRTVLGRVPPHIQIIFLGAIVVGIAAAVRTRQIPDVVWLALYAAGFLILITFVAKKADRYALPALIAFPVIAGWGVAAAANGMNKKLPKQFRFHLRSPGYVLAGVFIALMFIHLLSWYPYQIAYSNPIFPDIRPLPQQGWGEGLEAAAAWLNERPLAEKLYVATWYPNVFSTYFHGTALSLSSREDHRVSYIVAYRNMGGRALDTTASNVIDELKGKDPVHVISIHGVPYVWIYKTENIGLYYKHVGEITGSKQVGQVVPVSENNWSSIEIGMANYSDRKNTHDVALEVYEHVDDLVPIRTATVNASKIENESWQSFSFDPIPDSAGKTFYVAIRSPQSVPGDAITVRYSDADIAPGDMVFFREALKSGQKRSQFIRPGDIAYRIPQR